jgi:hypothetical protein
MEWARNPKIYDHYTNLLNTCAKYFDLFPHHVNVMRSTNQATFGSWGSKEYTG